MDSQSLGHSTSISHFIISISGKCSMSPYAANGSVVFCLGTVTVLMNSGQGKDNDNGVQSIESKKKGFLELRVCVSKAA